MLTKSNKQKKQYRSTPQTAEEAIEFRTINLGLPKSPIAKHYDSRDRQGRHVRNSGLVNH